jgi:uncharacterized protein
MKSVLLLCSILAAGISYLHAFEIPSTPGSYVNDYADMLSDAEERVLEARVLAFEASTTHEIAVVTVPDMGGDTVEHYAAELFEKWGIGNKDKDNGILFLIARDEHKVRIEVGYGLEETLPDSVAASILSNDVTPHFKQGDFGVGIESGVESIMKAIQGDYVIPSYELAPTPDSSSNFGNLLIFVGFFGIMFSQLLLRVSGKLAKTKSWWAGGVMGGMLGLVGIFIFGLSIGIVAVASLLIAAGLALDFSLSRLYQKKKTKGESIPSWLSGFSSNSSGSSGGFSSSSSSSSSFGGGSSGGGGASSSW